MSSKLLLICPGLLLFLFFGCGGGGSSGAAEQALTKSRHKAAAYPSDNQAALLRERGNPPVFMVSFHTHTRSGEQLSEPARTEKWIYSAPDGASFDFSNGYLVGSKQLPELRGALQNPVQLNPLQFRFGMNRQEIIAMLGPADWGEEGGTDSNIIETLRYDGSTTGHVLSATLVNNQLVAVVGGLYFR